MCTTKEPKILFVLYAANSPSRPSSRAFSTLSIEENAGLKALAEEEVSKMKEEIKLARDAEVQSIV